MVASFMIYTNTAALVGRSIPEDKLLLINKELEEDIMVRMVQDVKGIDMGNGIVRYKAEVDIDGRELAKYYLRKNNMPHLLEEIKNIHSEQELELFLLKHGENIVDCLGEQVRKKCFPFFEMPKFDFQSFNLFILGRPYGAEFKSNASRGQACGPGSTVKQ